MPKYKPPTAIIEQLRALMDVSCSTMTLEQALVRLYMLRTIILRDDTAATAERRKQPEHCAPELLLALDLAIRHVLDAHGLAEEGEFDVRAKLRGAAPPGGSGLQ